MRCFAVDVFALPLFAFPGTLEHLLTRFSFLDIGWLSLIAILEELKARPAKRGTGEDVEAGLAKRVKGVDLGGV